MYSGFIKWKYLHTTLLLRPHKICFVNGLGKGCSGGRDGGGHLFAQGSWVQQPSIPVCRNARNLSPKWWAPWASGKWWACQTSWPGGALTVRIKTKRDDKCYSIIIFLWPIWKSRIINFTLFPLNMWALSSILLIILSLMITFLKSTHWRHQLLGIVGCSRLNICQ